MDSNINRNPQFEGATHARRRLRGAGLYLINWIDKE